MSSNSESFSYWSAQVKFKLFVYGPLVVLLAVLKAFEHVPWSQKGLLVGAYTFLALVHLLFLLPIYLRRRHHRFVVQDGHIRHYLGDALELDRSLTEISSIRQEGSVMKTWTVLFKDGKSVKFDDDLGRYKRLVTILQNS